MSIEITGVRALDIRFPTSRTLDGSDAMNLDPDYSAAYVILQTNSDCGLEGHGLTFTIGRGNDICCKVIEMLGSLLMGKTLPLPSGDGRLRTGRANSPPTRRCGAPGRPAAP